MNHLVEVRSSLLIFLFDSSLAGAAASQQGTQLLCHLSGSCGPEKLPEKTLQVYLLRFFFSPRVFPLFSTAVIEVVCFHARSEKQPAAAS